MKLAGGKHVKTMNIAKQPPIVEDLRNHSEEELAELRAAGVKV